MLKVNSRKSFIQKGLFFNNTNSHKVENLPFHTWNQNMIILGIPHGFKTFIQNCDRFERHIRKNNLIRFHIIHLFKKLDQRNYILCFCQSLFYTYKITQMLVQMKQHFKHLKIKIQAFVIRSSNQKKLPISNYLISFILKNSS